MEDVGGVKRFQTADGLRVSFDPGTVVQADLVEEVLAVIIRQLLRADDAVPAVSY